MTHESYENHHYRNAPVECPMLMKDDQHLTILAGPVAEVNCGCSNVWLNH